MGAAKFMNAPLIPSRTEISNKSRKEKIDKKNIFSLVNEINHEKYTSVTAPETVVGGWSFHSFSGSFENSSRFEEFSFFHIAILPKFVPAANVSYIRNV